MLFQIIQTAYWLALSTAFGGVLFAAMSAPVIFRTIRQADPVLPTVLSVNMEGQHGTLLAGTLMIQILAQLWRIVAICGGVIAICLGAQFFIVNLDGSNYTAAILRCVLFAAGGVVMLYDRLVLWPVIEKNRRTYLDHADEPEVANPAKDQFDADHRLSVNLLMLLTACLLGLVLFSVTITPRSRELPLRSPSAQADAPPAWNSVALELPASDGLGVSFAGEQADWPMKLASGAVTLAIPITIPITIPVTTPGGIA